MLDYSVKVGSARRNPERSLLFSQALRPMLRPRRRLCHERIGGGPRDLTRPITEDAAIETVTARDASAEVLELIEHDAAHALAEVRKGALAGQPGHHWSRHRGRLHLRLRARRTFHAGRPRGDGAHPRGVGPQRGRPVLRVQSRCIGEEYNAEILPNFPRG